MKELAFAFLRLGLTAFGGPAAHIAMMEDEFVRRRAWLTREQFLDLVGAASLIPGPSSTEVAIYIGYRRAGVRGLVLAGTCFILPAALIVTAIAWAYVHFGRLPAASAILYGVKPVIIAILAQALVGFAKTALKTRGLALLCALATIASGAAVSPLLILVCAGALSIARAGLFKPRNASAAFLGLPPTTTATATATATTTTTTTTTTAATPTTTTTAAATATTTATATKTAIVLAPAAGLVPAAPVGLAKLFAIFFKTGALVFGSGYVLLAFLRTDLVDGQHWLTEPQLVDAVAVGQLTPGPVFTTATFIGYVLAGVPGAVLATIAIFLPSFGFVAVSGPLLPRLRRSRIASSFLDGVNVASLALMVVVGVELGRAAIVDVRTVALAVASAVALFRFRVNTAWLVLGGGTVGFLLSHF